MAAGAALAGRDPARVLAPFHVLQVPPLDRGATAGIWVELAVPSAGAIGPFTLKLWEAGETRTLHP